MKALSVKELDEIFKKIQQYKLENEKLNDAFRSIGQGNFFIDCGGGLLDSIIELLERICNDSENVIEWYIFENEFGKNNLTKTVSGTEINIKSTKELLIYLSSVQLK